MEGFFPIFFLAVILKIPVGLLLYLVWWALRAHDQPEEAPESDDGGPRRFRREPKRPRGPRRGPGSPDARPLPSCPPGGRLRAYPSAGPVRVASHHRERRGAPHRVRR